MKYRPLGKTGLSVSEISIGCSGFWGSRAFPEKDAEAIIRTAYDLGVNCFDTGHNYSGFNAEPRLGRILSKIFRADGRESVLVSTKAGTTIPHASILSGGHREYEKDFSPDAIEASCVASIRNLQCDYIDIFHLHGIRRSEISPALIDRLEKMKSAGLFRFLSINTHEIPEMDFAAKNASLFDIALIDYNLLQRDRADVIAKLNDAGVGVMVGTALAQGHLVKNRLTVPRTIGDAWYLARALVKPAGRQLLKKSKRIREVLLQQQGVTPAQLAIGFVLSNSFVSTCIFGTTQLENLTDVAHTVELLKTPHFADILNEINLIDR